MLFNGPRCKYHQVKVYILLIFPKTFNVQQKQMNWPCQGRNCKSEYILSCSEMNSPKSISLSVHLSAQQAFLTPTVQIDMQYGLDIHGP